MSDELKQVFNTPDGESFDTKAEALDHLRLPKIKTALEAVTDGNAELVDWLTENQDTVLNAFDIGTIRRVTKSERNKMRKALDAIVKADEKAFAFVAENADAIHETFRWPSVKRMDEDEKASAAKSTLLAASDNNEELADWVVANKDAIIGAYAAGKVKREVSQKAKDGLANYRAKKAAEKAAAEAA
ncbi:MAG: hypothetical protein DRH08_01875 [Deltaproteobacteria bacterium]|nr:MAG: hypothetical protein DRH08_01875 [Deltaproteobacteria bacterium]